MITGHVDQTHNPIIPVDLLEQGRRLHRIEIPIDTGFQGFLMLPLRIILQMGGMPNRRIRMTLANERSGSFDEYLTRLLWFDQIREVPTLASTDEFLVGLFLLAESRIEIDLTPGGTVTISELPAS